MIWLERKRLAVLGRNNSPVMSAAHFTDDRFAPL